MLHLNSYLVIVACVASGTGIALVPESALDAMPTTNVLRHALPKAQTHLAIPRMRRRSEIAPPVPAMRTLVETEWQN
jgi:DNA-binding transcriptional LysR family regulator